jgi:uroporphyrinogen-III synthase
MKVVSRPSHGTHDGPVHGDDAGIAALARIASRLAFPAAPLEGFLSDAAEFAASAANCDSCVLYLVEDGELVVRAAANAPRWGAERLRLKCGKANEWLTRLREPVVLWRLAYADSRYRLFSDSPDDTTEMFLCFPIILTEALAGVLNLYNGAERAHDATNVNLISVTSSLLSAAIDRARLRDENGQLTEQLESRKVIERAKGVLQRDLRISEEEAYLTLQHESRRRRISMKEVAAAILLSDDLKRSR